MSTLDDDILSAAEHWRAEGRAVAIATVIETWGSAPRPVGSHLAIDGEGHFLGSVSGGCVEGAVVTVALEVLATGQAQRCTFGYSDDQAYAVGLTCGGTVHLLVEPLER